SLIKGFLLSLPAISAVGGLGTRLFAADRPGKPEPDELARLASHRLYLVVFKEARPINDPRRVPGRGAARVAIRPGFDDRRRRELGILGPFVRNLQGDLKDKSGWLTWAAPADVAKLAEAPEIEAVTPILPDDKPDPQGRPDRRSKTLIAMLAPNMWQEKPAAETYADSKRVAEDLAKLLTEQKVDVAARNEMFLTVRLADLALADAVVAKLKQHPQVASLEWDAVATTLAIGEEGGNRITTQALGEEGNPPRPTTKRLGEEGGGRPTTEAIGEEGGRPPQQVTTFALGEEG
ncbi:MAG: hypothetical protein WD030_06200, partial [Pirellulales bacterium]